MSTQLEVIQKFTKSLDNSSKYGVSALNEAVKYASNGLFTSWSDLVNSFVSDVKNYGGSGDSDSTTLDSSTSTFLKTYCGINLSNTDTGAITGYDAGTSSTQIGANDIVPEDSTTATYPTESSTTYNGLTVIWPNKSKLTDKQIEIVSALYTWWFQSALDLVEKSTGLSYEESDVNSHTMTITFTTRNSSVLASANNTNLTINSTAWESVDITGAENSGQRSRGSLADRIIAHELTHAVMAANVSETLWDNDLVASSEGLAELTHGADDGRKSEIINLAQSVNTDRLEKALYYTYSSSEDYYDSYASGYMILRYLAKQVADNSPFEGTAQVNLSNARSSGIFFVNNSSTGKVNATFQTSSIGTGQTQIGTVSQKTNYNTYKATLDLGQYITAASLTTNWSIKGTSGDDTIKGGKGSDTLIGGDGNDYFYYNGGNDVISDYESSSDTLVLSADTISSSSISGSDIIMYMTGGGTIKIRNGKSKEITVKDAKGITSSKIYGENEGLSYDDNATAVTITSSYDGTLKTSDYYSTVKLIDASSRNSSIYINGNSKANTIKGSSKADTIYAGSGADTVYGYAGADYISGGSGNDYLIGGSGIDTLIGDRGNDTLTGGSGNDLFMYSYGNDIITDYSSSDKIKLTSNSISSASLSGSNVMVTVGSGNLTVKNGRNKLITITDVNNKTTRLLFGSSGGKSLTGSSYADSIVAGSGKDTIKAGKGKDTITGGSGADVFIYSTGDGKDTITDYSSNDRISLNASYSTVASGSNVIVNVGTGSITLLNAKNKTLNITSTAEENFSERWFIDKNECVNTELESIIEDKIKYTVGDTSQKIKSSYQLPITHYTLNKGDKK